MATTSTSHRKSFGRQRPSFGSSKLNTVSSSVLTSSFAPPDIPPLPTSQRIPTTATEGSSAATSRPLEIRFAQGGDQSKYASSVANEGSSPITMNPLRPSANRNFSDDRNGNQNLEVGDTVDVPGGMHGTIKFIGAVKGKAGMFAGVELAKEWAARGKNDGDVDGIRYFTTSTRGAGIFLPSNKAYKRLSPTISSGDSMPPTPTTPSLGIYTPGSKAEKPTYTPPTPAPKFSQSVGPGRVPSPTMRAKRPSIPRPESPLRKAQNTTSAPLARPSLGKPNFSKSMMGGPRYAPSPTPSKFGASVRGTRDVIGDPGKRPPVTPKPAIRKPTGARPTSPSRNESRNESRSESRLGPEAMFDEESDNTPVGFSKIAPAPRAGQSKSRPASKQDEELRMLKMQLVERDRQLEKYATDLDEMQNSVAELQTLTPKHNSVTVRSSRGSGIDDLNISDLRALVREKNEKITALTQEFDVHRADFRETIDLLERTSDQTTAHYEARVAGLLEELGAHANRDDDLSNVSANLEALGRHVEELEEGLEDSRRGESEARGEVEHLRGEVERGKAELRRERQRAAAAPIALPEGTPEARWQREIAHRDNEINGLKAIIHSLSRDAASGSPTSPRSSRRSKHNSHSQANGHLDAQLAEERQARDKLECEVRDLESIVDRKTYREEELENEIQHLRKHNSQISNGYSDRTTTNRNHSYTSDNSQWRETPQHTTSPQKAAQQQQRPKQRSASNLESDGGHSTTVTDSSALWCDMCETAGHDILHCNSMGSSQHPQTVSSPNGTADRSANKYPQHNLDPYPNDFPAPLSPARSPVLGNGRDSDIVPPTALPQQQSRPKPNPLDSGLVPGKGSGVVDAMKWCAVCERDGHESVDCPFDYVSS